MSDLDKLYLAILQSGLSAIRNAAQNGDLEYCKIESEHLHELPSLIGEQNLNRHMYYIAHVRRTYLEWATENSRENVRELLTYFYSGAWKQMDAILGITPSQGENRENR